MAAHELAGVYAIGERVPTFASDDYFIAPGAQVIGSVRLGVTASVWFNAVLRADDAVIDIGDGSNVQDGTIIHVDRGSPAMIGRNVTIGHQVILHACTIGDESLVGNGAVVLDRAKIGRHCIIAAGALVPPDRDIPDGSVVMGSPCRVMRATEEADLALIRGAAASYQARVRRYQDQFRRLKDSSKASTSPG